MMMIKIRKRIKSRSKRKIKAVYSYS